MVSDQLTQSAEASIKSDEDYIATMGSRLSDLRALIAKQKELTSQASKRRAKN